MIPLSWFIDTTSGRIVLVTGILVLTFFVAQLTKFLLARSFKKPHRILKVDQTKYVVLKHVMSGLIYIVGISVAIYMIPSLRALSISLFAGAGVLAIIVGFASQQTFANIISGIFIALFEPFRIGDWVKIQNSVSGTVEDITLRHTIIRNFENKRVIVPNAVMNNEIIENAHINDEKTCKFVEIGISYDADVDLAMKIMSEEIQKHPYFLDKRTDEEKLEKKEPVMTLVTGFGDSSVKLRAYAWAKDPMEAWRLGCDVHKTIKERFDKEGVEIPFPYRTIVYKKDLPKAKKLMRKSSAKKVTRKVTARKTTKTRKVRKKRR